MLKADALVVGAGIFGSVIARALAKTGLDVAVVDSRMANAGSGPAACLMKPSWFSSLGKDVYNPALAKLDELIGVEEVVFRVPTGTAVVQWCQPSKVLLPPSGVISDSVVALTTSGSDTIALLKSGSLISARVVVVAAGIWTPLFFPEIKVQGQAGAAWLWPEARTSEPRIKIWAPYKQLVAFNRGDGLWVGDGTSVLAWSDTYRDASLKRCRAMVEHEPYTAAEPTMLLGYRPYIKEPGPCMLKKMHKGVWVATGGAKNGTLAAGWCADQLIRAVA